MGLFSKEKIAKQVFVKSKKLHCDVCNNDMFIYENPN